MYRRCCCLQVPLNAHLWRSVSFSNASWTPITFLGVTQVLMSSSPTLPGVSGGGSGITVELGGAGSCLCSEVKVAVSRNAYPLF